MNKIKNNKKLLIKIIVGVLILIIIIFGTTSLTKYFDIKKKKDNFKEEKYYCRKSVNNNLYRAELNSIDYTTVKVYIEENHNNISNAPDNLKDFFNDVCDAQKYAAKDRQIDYIHKCGDSKDTIKYTYIGSMQEAITQLEDDEYECYTIKKNGNLLSKIKNKYWCNYRKHKYYFTFDENHATENGNIYQTEYNYSIDNNTIIIHQNSYDIKYTYNEEKNILVEDGSSNDYLFECETPEENYSVSVKYYYDGKLNSNMPKSGFYKDDEYKFNHVECSDGITATFDENRRMLFPSENKKSECIVYFDKLN